MICVVLVSVPRDLPNIMPTPFILLFWLTGYVPKGTQKSGMFSAHMEDTSYSLVIKS